MKRIFGEKETMIEQKEFNDPHGDEDKQHVINDKAKRFILNSRITVEAIQKQEKPFKNALKKPIS